MTVSWNRDPGEYLAALARTQMDSIERDIVALVESILDAVEAWMKENARWNDQTGRARAGLWTDINHITHEAVYLTMNHDVTLDYTWYLEANPRTALLGDTVDYVWPLLYRGVTSIVERHSSRRAA